MPMTQNKPSAKKHSHGPWKAVRLDNGEYEIECEEGYSIADVVLAIQENSSIARANAYLIAAAPELLRELVYARRFLNTKDHDTETIDAVIAKAQQL